MLGYLEPIYGAHLLYYCLNSEIWYLFIEVSHNITELKPHKDFHFEDFKNYYLL